MKLMITGPMKYVGGYDVKLGVVVAPVLLGDKQAEAKFYPGEGKIICLPNLEKADVSEAMNEFKLFAIDEQRRQDELKAADAKRQLEAEYQMSVHSLRPYIDTLPYSISGWQTFAEYCANKNDQLTITDGEYTVFVSGNARDKFAVSYSSLGAWRGDKKTSKRERVKGLVMTMINDAQDKAMLELNRDLARTRNLARMQAVTRCSQLREDTVFSGSYSVLAQDGERIVRVTGGTETHQQYQITVTLPEEKLAALFELLGLAESTGKGGCDT